MGYERGGGCWETRRLNNAQKEAIVNNDTNKIDENSNFTNFLNNWGPLEGTIRIVEDEG